MKIKRDLLIILTMCFIGICFGHIQSYAAYHYDKVSCPGQMAVEMDYDDVKDWEYTGEALHSASAWASTKLIYGVPNCVCMHGDAITGESADKTATVILVLTIEADGTCYMTCDGHTKRTNITGNSDDAKYYAKALAYMAYALKEDPNDKFDYYDSYIPGYDMNHNAYHFIKNPDTECYREFRKMWNNFYNNSKLNQYMDVKASGSSTSDADTYYYHQAEKYANGKMSSSKSYVAKIFITSNPNGQGRAIIIGKEENSSDISINKYISKVGNTSYDRSELSKTEKKNDPVQVGPGNLITFTIKVSSTTNETINITDEFSEDYFTYDSDDNNYEQYNYKWSGKNGEYILKVGNSKDIKIGRRRNINI